MPAPARPLRPGLEALEDRAVPAFHTWTDAGGTNLWSDPANWDANGVPVNTVVGNGTIVILPLDDATIVQDIPNLTIAAINFTNPGSAALTLVGPLTIQTSAAGGNLVNSSGANLITGGELVMVSTTFMELVVFGGALTVESPISGSQGIVKRGLNTLTLGGSSTYSGGTTVRDGRLAYTAGAALGTGPVLVGDILTPVGAFPTLEAASQADTLLPNAITVNQPGAIVGSQADDTGPVVTFAGDVTLNLAAGGLLFLHAGSSARTVFTGRVTGNGGVAAWSPDVPGRTILLDNPLPTNDFVGGVYVYEDAVLQLTDAATAAQIPDAAFVFFVNAGSTLRVYDIDETVGTLYAAPGVGVVEATGAGRTLAIGADNAGGTFGGSVTAAGTLAKVGTATQLLSGGVTAAGVTVAGGFLVLDGTVVGPVTVAADAAVGGTGTLTNGVSVGAAGYVTAAAGGAAGTLTATSAVVQSGGFFDIDVLGVAPGQYDALAVTGPATLAGELLVVQNPSLVLPVGTTLTVLTATALTGTFAGLPEGAAFSPDGSAQRYRVSYAGNAVTLTAVDAAAPTAQLGPTPHVTAASNPTRYTLFVIYGDDSAIDPNSLGTGDVRVTGPNGFTATPQFDGVTVGGDPVTVRYTFIPPGGKWDAADNGSYTIEVLGTQVTDTAGKAVPAAALGTFNVTVAAAGRRVAAGGGAGGAAQLLTADPAGAFTAGAAVTPLPELPAGVNVRTATGDVDGDGVPDAIAVTGPGTPIRVTVFSGADHATVLVAPFDPFGGDFTGGGFVAAGDFDGDGRDEFLVTPDEGGGPRVTVFGRDTDGSTAVRANFFGIDDASFRGGARAAVGDVNGDGTPDLVVAAGFGGGPRTAVFTGQSVLSGPLVRVVNDFFAFPGTDAVNLRNGVFVASGDVDGDGKDDLLFGGGPGGAPRVFILSGALVSAGDVAGAQAAPVANFFVAGNATDRGGVRVAVVDADGDPRADVAAGSGEGSPARVRVYLGSSFSGSGEPGTFQDVSVFGGAALPGGVFVG